MDDLRAKNGQRAVPVWTHMNLRESPRPEVGPKMTKDIGQLSLSLAVEELAIRESYSQERGAGREWSRGVRMATLVEKAAWGQLDYWD